MCVDRLFPIGGTYNGGDICVFHIACDCDSLNQELVLAFGVERGFVLHRLQQHYLNYQLMPSG